MSYQLVIVDGVRKPFAMMMLKGQLKPECDQFIIEISNLNRYQWRHRDFSEALQ